MLYQMLLNPNRSKEEKTDYKSFRFEKIQPKKQTYVRYHTYNVRCL